ncbi:MAG: Kelch repeat-containing protein [Tepidisphaeraceae bacterium]
MSHRFIDSLEPRRLLHADFGVSINFAPLGNRAPGMLLDYGSVYDVRRGGLSYGWDADASADAVKRNATKVKRNDAFIAMQGKTWNIGVENGTYSVYIVGGDPTTFNDRMAITAEGQVVVSGITKSARRYLEGQATVTVTDGKLTIGNAACDTGDKFCYIGIASVETTPNYLDITASTPNASEATQTPGAFTITRGGSDESLASALTVPLSVSGTATNGVDYGKIGSAITFRAGVSSITIPVRVVDDGVTEGDESVILSLGAVNGYTNVESAATVTIEDDVPVAHTTLTWTTAASRPVAASEIFGGFVGGKLYTFGGFTDSSFKPSSALYIYDPATNHWSTGASLPIGLTHPGVATDSTSIYFAGGYPGNGPSGYQTFSTTAVYRYNVSSNTYTALPNLPIARGAGSMAKLGNSLYFMGGDDSSRNDVTTMWALDLTNLGAGWVTKASIPAPRNHAGAVVLNGSMYLVAGQTGQDAALVTHPSLYRYNASSDTWTTLANLPSGRSHVTDATFAFDNKIVVLGGQSPYNSPLSSNLEYDPTTNTWTTIASLPGPRFSGVGEAVDASTFVYTAGYNSTFSSTTYIGKWT